MEMNQYLSMFIDESNDHLQSLNDNMMQLENNPEDISIVQVIFRSAHTLKGMSATMGFNDLASLTHQMENVLDLVRNDELKMNEFIFDTLFKSLDALENMVQDITQGGEGHADVTSIVETLQSIVRGDYGQAAASNEAPVTTSSQNTTDGFRLDQFQYSVLEQSVQAGLSVFYLEVVIREDCVLKGVRAYMVFDALEKNGEVVKTNPSVQDIEQEKFERGFSLYYISKIDQESLHQLISNISEIESVHILPVDNETLVQISQEDDEVNEVTSQIQQAVQGKAVTAGSQNTTNGFRLDQFQYSVLDQSIQAGLAVFFLDVIIREDCLLKGVRAYMVFDALDQNGEIVKSNPSVQDIEQEKFERSFSIYYISKIDQESLHQLISSISEIESVHILPVDNETLIQISQEDDVVNEATSQIQQAVQEIAVTVDTAKPRASAAASTPAPARKPNAGGASSGHAASRTIRVDIDRLDGLMNLFSELLIDRVRLEQLASDLKSQDLTETVEHMARVSGDLQNIVLKLRMVPIDTVFNRFPRMIRDLAKSLDKKVDFVITGAETELDRTVIEEIGDPLVHLLRNAVDHGLESVDGRVAAGKSETGTLQLRAFHSGNHVFIEIEDDGQGINREKVLKIAIKNGVISQDEAKSMSDEQVYQLLFAAGFSTADKVSDISGRGVGLDVVKSKILSLGGNVTVDSNWGKGSKFSVQLPLTLSIISAMLVRVGNEKYALPLSSIVETIIIERKHIRHVHGTKMIDYRQSVIPIASLAEIFDCETADDEKESTEVVVIRKGDRLAAFMVDDFIGQNEIVLKSLGKYLTNIHGISGATILGDGQVALIIDPNALVK